jgi:hypothetical protein
MPVVSVYQQGTFRHHRHRFDRRSRKEREATRIVGIVGAPFDVDTFAIEVGRVIDEDHFRAAGTAGIAEESNLLAARAYVHRDFFTDLLEISRDLSNGAIQRNDHDYADSLPRLHISEPLNSFSKPARSRVRREFGSQVHDGDRIA